MDSLLDRADFRPAPYRLNASQYSALGATGILHPDEPIELIEGEIVDMAPAGPEHGAAVAGLTRALEQACERRAIVSVQTPIRLDHWNVAKPDVAVFRFREDRYASGARATPADALLLVEVADTSSGHDKTIKLPLYARAGIPEYWIVDFQEKVLGIHRRPDLHRYAREHQTAASGTVLLWSEPWFSVALDGLFG